MILHEEGKKIMNVRILVFYAISMYCTSMAVGVSDEIGSVISDIKPYSFITRNIIGLTASAYCIYKGVQYSDNIKITLSTLGMVYFFNELYQNKQVKIDKKEQVKNTSIKQSLIIEFFKCGVLCVGLRGLFKSDLNTTILGLLGSNIRLDKHDLNAFYVCLYMRFLSKVKS